MALTRRKAPGLGGGGGATDLPANFSRRGAVEMVQIVSSRTTPQATREAATIHLLGDRSRPLLAVVALGIPHSVEAAALPGGGAIRLVGIHLALLVDNFF